MSIDPKRVKEIFLVAVEQADAAARVAYLDRACGGDAGLRGRVEALLRSHDPDGSFLGTPAAVVPDPDPALRWARRSRVCVTIEYGPDAKQLREVFTPLPAEVTREV